MGTRRTRLGAGLAILGLGLAVVLWGYADRRLERRIEGFLGAQRGVLAVDGVEIGFPNRLSLATLSIPRGEPGRMAIGRLSGRFDLLPLRHGRFVAHLTGEIFGGEAEIGVRYPGAGDDPEPSMEGLDLSVNVTSATLPDFSLGPYRLPPNGNAKLTGELRYRPVKVTVTDALVDGDDYRLTVNGDLLRDRGWQQSPLHARLVYKRERGVRIAYGALLGKDHAHAMRLSTRRWREQAASAPGHPGPDITVEVAPDAAPALRDAFAKEVVRALSDLKRAIDKPADATQRPP